MAKIHRPPTLFQPPKGITSDSIYVYGTQVWVEKLLADLKPIVGVNILLSDYSSQYPLWDYQAIAESDIALFYLTGQAPEEVVLSYLMVSAWAQFPPEVYVYSTSDCCFADEVEFLSEKKLFRAVDSGKELVKIGVSYFDYLKEIR